MTLKRECGSDKSTGLCKLAIDEDMTIHAIGTLKQGLSDEIDIYSRFELNLSGVDEFDSAGVQLLLALKNELMTKKKELALSSVSGSVAKMIERYSIGEHFNIGGIERDEAPLEPDQLLQQYYHAKHSLQMVGSRTLPIWSGQIGDCIEISTQEMNQLTQQFSGIVSNLHSITTLDRSEREKVSSEITQEIERVLVSLQFQDRVSQILGHVSRNMSELAVQIKDHQNLDIEKYIEKMADEYTTSNERDTHRALTGNDSIEAPMESDDGEVVFF